jgi:hypothetical protein
MSGASATSERGHLLAWRPDKGDEWLQTYEGPVTLYAECNADPVAGVLPPQYAGERAEAV